MLALEVDWARPYHELIELWTLGAFLVGLGALPAGWLGDRWSASGMMVIYFMGLGISGIVCGLLDTSSALLVGLASIGLFSSIYHPVGIAFGALLFGFMDRSSLILDLKDVPREIVTIFQGVVVLSVVIVYEVVARYVQRRTIAAAARATAEQPEAVAA